MPPEPEPEPDPEPETAQPVPGEPPEPETAQPVPGEPHDEPEERAPLPRLVLGGRSPEPVVWRIHGALAPESASQTGASIPCTTTFAARRAQREVVENGGPTGPKAPLRGVLGGPMPAHDRSGSRARVGVEVVLEDQLVTPSSEHVRRRARRKP
ncbi:hypothetical protein [Enhygromyxa salina]|uniref:Uncharacterized protein n=1 Tax=Enhygromyxa salina TaxID=215803 RepID=A0A2S9YUE8_9BACT|nr:hypothetical protein [Enhygromyxa salina]PRQ08662.1 hypothetical protein ENSA7_16070 [Enhygromyxa salina]